MPFGDYASLEEMHHLGNIPEEQVMDWMQSMVNYSHDNRTIRMFYSHPYDLEEYITKSYNLLSRMFKDILDQLESKALIKCRKGYKLFKVNNMGLQSGSKVVTLGSKEETIIIKAEEEGLKEMGLTKLFEVYRNEISIETFKKITNRKIKEQFPDYDGYSSEDYGGASDYDLDDIQF